MYVHIFISDRSSYQGKEKEGKKKLEAQGFHGDHKTSGALSRIHADLIFSISLLLFGSQLLCSHFRDSLTGICCFSTLTAIMDLIEVFGRTGPPPHPSILTIPTPPLQRAAIAIMILFPTLATIFFGMRAYIRITMRQLGWDDFLCGMALVRYTEQTFIEISFI